MSADGGELLRRELDEDLDVRVREIPGHAVHAALQPVLVDSTDEVDNVGLLEAELALVLRLKVIQSLAARLPAAYVTTTNSPSHPYNHRTTSQR